MLLLKESTREEIIILHDSYYCSSEPDAPKYLFHNLSSTEQMRVINDWGTENYLSLFDGGKLVGFIGHFPDEDFDNVNLFYVVIPSERGNGYLSKMLEAFKEYASINYYEYKKIRTLTRAKNFPSIKGLEKSSFVHQGEFREQCDPDIVYEEHFFKIQP